jgi:hypothetical protein
VRARIAAVLEGLVLTTGTLGTLTEAHCGYDAMPTGVSRVRSHLAFGVAVPRTESPVEQRQRQGRILYVSTPVAVRLLHRHRSTDAIADVDAALAAESEVIVAVLSTAGTSGLQVTYTGTSSRGSVSDPAELYMLQLDFLATYHIATT